MHGHARRQVVNLYRSLLNAGRAYPDYNIRDYVLRRVRQDFRKNAGLAGPELTEAVAFGTAQLSLIHRQAAIAASYPHEMSVMETLGGAGSSSVGGSSGRAAAAAAAVAAGGAVPVQQEEGGEDDDESMVAGPRDKA